MPEAGESFQEFDLVGLLEDRRRLAVAMLRGFQVNAFEKPHTPEDIAFCEAEIADCDRQLNEIRNAVRS